MKQTAIVRVRREALPMICLAVSVLLVPGGARAGLTGSRHDFTGVLGSPTMPGGSCSACHIPHFAQGAVIWSRNLDAERLYFNQILNPNYAPGRTIQCYDCHDNHVRVDNDPPDSAFNPIRLAQDVAFDDDMKTTLLRDGLDNDNKPGYYENIPSRTAGAASTFISGHYVKNEPGVGGIARGDKLPCSDCHNPHSTVNQAFIRGTLGGKAVSGRKASMRMAYTEALKDNRDDADSRNFCITCHGTSEQAVYKAVTFKDVNPLYGGATIARPTTNISAHQAGRTQACTSCHLHNRIAANCTDCHGYPPLVASAFHPVDNKFGQSYSGGAGAHQRHYDALGAAIFDCAICHGPDPGSAVWHNAGGGTVLPGQVDIMGMTSWWGSGSNYYGVDGTETLPSGYAFEKKGGSPQVCANLACHGYPAGTSGDAGALNWTDDMVDDATGAATADIEVCAWCHDATPAVLDKDGDGVTFGPVKAPNIMGAGAGTAAWGAAVNGHGLPSGNNYEGDVVGEGSRTGRAAANKGCAVCHDATYTAGIVGATYTPGSADKTHFDGAYRSAQKRLNDSINGETLTAIKPANGTVSDAACIACHQRTTGSDDGMQVSSHGNTSLNYNRLETTEFQILCRACHEPHGRNWNGATRNLHMIGTWLDNPGAPATWGATDAGEQARVDSNSAKITPAPAVAITTDDNAVVFTSRGLPNGPAADSFDENDAADADDICATCHVPAGAPGSGVGTGGGSHAGTTGYTGDERGNNCMTCHDHDFDDLVATYPYDAFLPFGGSDIEQFFDAETTPNYNAVSGHALKMTLPLTYTVPPDCIGCHQTPNGTGVSNECLKCHYEGYVSGGTTWVWAGHANGSQTLELRSSLTPALTTAPYTAACNPNVNCISIPKRSTNTDADGTADVYPHCLACHDVATPNASHQLGGQSPVDIVPGAGTWTGGFGHGSAVTLSSERGANGAGPPRYDCGACHSSTVTTTILNAPPPTYHASVNLKLVANRTGPYPSPEYDTTAEKNSWCATRCHRTDGGSSAKDNNPDNSIAKDNNVIDHFWAPNASPSEAADQTDCPMGAVDPNGVLCETHPSYQTITVGDLYKLPTGLPVDGSVFTCGTCHEPHGNTTATDGQMIRLNYSNGTLCKECHK